MIEQPNENTIRKVLKNEAVVLVSIIGAVFSFVMFVVIPQQKTATDIALIQASIKKIEENHMKHIEDYALEIKTIKSNQEQLQKDYIELVRSLERTLTILELNK